MAYFNLCFLARAEPGYYKEGEFGIRIESIIRVVKADTLYRHNDQDFLTFKHTTMVPIQAVLIDTCLLTVSEVRPNLALPNLTYPTQPNPTIT